MIVPRRSSRTRLNPDFLSEVVLYALSVADVTMLLALVFVLARNVIKLSSSGAAGCRSRASAQSWWWRCSG